MKDLLKKNNIYKNKLLKIANELEALRLEMYPQIDEDIEKNTFDDELFHLQSEIRNLSDSVYYLFFK